MESLFQKLYEFLFRYTEMKEFYTTVDTWFKVSFLEIYNKLTNKMIMVRFFLSFIIREKNDVDL